MSRQLFPRLSDDHSVGQFRINGQLVRMLVYILSVGNITLRDREIYSENEFISDDESIHADANSTQTCRKLDDLDVSSVDYPGEVLVVPIWQTVVVVTIYAIIGIFAIGGNGIIISMFFIHKFLRTAANYYIINLALADLLVASLAMWIKPVEDLTDGWVLGTFGCKFNIFIQMSGMCASVFTLSVISVDRFFAIVLPLKPRITKHKRKALVLITSIWTMAVIIASPLLVVFTYYEIQWKDYTERICEDRWPSCESFIVPLSKKFYWSFVIVVFAWVPMVSMSVLYGVMVHKLTTDQLGPTSMLSRQSLIQTNARKKMVRMLIAVLGMFVLCWLPYQILCLINVFNSVIDDQKVQKLSPFIFAVNTLAFANGAVDPLIFGAMNENFRRAFRVTFTRCLPHDAWSLNERSNRVFDIDSARNSTVAESTINS
ncbi:unnamed protein product [Owenia fusiformis]|uniref:G-protein coupled receptors family 1 profile domain-containing protein n=1 Tax=Owenia fusiformis TaxID=6347 RepID=A0A8S4PNK7_OWEFU|nr:unnamed protein product [Owenia fusiformis]